MQYMVKLSSEDGHALAESVDFDVAVDAPDADAALREVKEKMASEAVLRRKEGKGVPKPSPLPDPPWEGVALVEIDPEAESRKRATRTVRRTISIPEWMDLEIKENKVNASRLFQDAYMREHGSLSAPPAKELGEKDLSDAVAQLILARLGLGGGRKEESK